MLDGNRSLVLMIDRKHTELGQHVVTIVAKPRLAPLHHHVQEIVPRPEELLPQSAVEPNVQPSSISRGELSVLEN